MTSILIVVVLLALGVGVVLWAVRRRPAGPPSPVLDESDTAWNDPVTPAGRPHDETAPRP